MTHRLAQSLAGGELIERSGRVVAIRGNVIESQGPATQLGERCRIESSPPIDAEVVGFDRGAAFLMPFGSVEGLSLGDRIVALGRFPEVAVGHQLLGRVLDAFGAPIDDLEPLLTMERRRLRAQSPSVLHRQRVDSVFETGVKVIDTMLTLARGQRIALMAGSGVGKSTLMGMMARSSRAAVNVIALVGERSREVREFIEDQLGPEGLRRSVVVVATAEEPAIVRTRAAYAATTIAEFFRERGDDVLLMMDSITRFAMARREIGLAVGEPPTARGYTPSVFSELPQLCERGGAGAGRGAITSVYTVLVEGDDMNEPVADTMRATLDGHIVLSRDIANAGRFPAVDVLRSVSRLHHRLAGERAESVRKIIACCALYERNRQLIEVGAHKPGVNAALDVAVAAMPKIQSFLSQPQDRLIARADALQELSALVAQLETARE